MPPRRKKIYVLDTSVIIYDHNAIHQFQDDDVAIPITVLEELDNFKKGNDSKNFSAREFIRFIDRVAGEHLLEDWIPLEQTAGRLKVVMGGKGHLDAERIFDDGKSDNKILNAALALQLSEKNRTVVLVTKDIALRVKAKSLGIKAEDYESGKVPDVEKLFSGKCFIENVASETIDMIYRDGSIPPEAVGWNHRVENQYFVLKNGKKSAIACFNSLQNLIERVDKRTAYGISPRNAEQAFALHALLNPHVRLVTLQGVAGTGKTLLALAAALEQRDIYKQICVSRPVVPFGHKDLGYLPGDIKSKMNPYMEPLWDNLKLIKNQFNPKDKEYKQIEDMLRTDKIQITPLTYVRGRSVSSAYFIIDEAQNLTPHEVKTIITRAGEGTKIVFTGDIHQIDTPYLDARSNGLSHLIDRFKNHRLFAHITLEKGERSALANLANELL